MTFFEMVPMVLIAAVGLVLAAVGWFVFRAVREMQSARESAPEPAFDCRENVLIASGEGVRRDC